MQNSASPRFPDGLANSGGLVGKRLNASRADGVAGEDDDFGGPGNARRRPGRNRPRLTPCRGTVLYAGHFPRFHPSDFRVRTLDGVADDWPIDYPTLEPFYAENDRMMGVSGLVGDPANPPHEPMMPPLPLGKSGQTLARGLNKLGWHWWPSDSAIASAEYEGRAKCINLGHCTSGCAQGAKASTDITYWPAAIRAGVELRTRCRVREITTMR